jgi:hypothetical protein
MGILACGFFFQDSIKPAVGSQVKEAQDEVHSGA